MMSVFHEFLDGAGRELASWSGSQKVLSKVRWPWKCMGDSVFSMMRMASSISRSAAKASGLQQSHFSFQCDAHGVVSAACLYPSGGFD